jgi:putative transposase
VVGITCTTGWRAGRDVFADPNEAIELIEIIRDIKDRDGWTVVAWCVMSNHFHLVLRSSSIPIWRGMHGVQNQFSRRHNRRHGRTGALWQGRYKAKLVAEQTHLDRLILYVHLNPATAFVVDDPKEYAFSGHREVVREPKSSLVDIDDLLLSFGDTRRTARRNYLKAIRAGLRARMDDEPLEGILGWHPFTSAESAIEPRTSPVGVDMLGRSEDLERPRMNAEDFVRGICELAGFDFDHLSSRSRDRQAADARKVISVLGIERWEQSRTEIARVLSKNPDVVSYWAGEGAKRRRADPEYAEMLDELDADLEKGSRNAGMESTF